jgi:hypothetical protein
VGGGRENIAGQSEVTIILIHGMLPEQFKHFSTINWTISDKGSNLAHQDKLIIDKVCFHRGAGLWFLGLVPSFKITVIILNRQAINVDYVLISHKPSWYSSHLVINH